MIEHWYDLISVFVAVAFAALAVWGLRTGGRSRLWIVWGATSSILLIAGFLAWNQLRTMEGPLIAYVAVALVPTTLSALWVMWFGSRQMSPVLLAIGAAIVWWLACIWAFVVGICILPAFVPI